jgi:hypothetical protein
MLFEILKALGLDVPARLNSLKADFDQRVEQTTAQVSQVAQQAALLVALYTLAAVAALLAIGVGLVALCLRVAESYGVYAGLGVVSAILLAAALLLGGIAVARSRSLGRSGARTPRAVTATRAAQPVAAPALPPSEGARPTAGDVVQPLAVLLSKLIWPRGQGQPMAAQFFGELGESGPGAEDSALNRAANVVRHGDRGNVLMVLTGAMVVGWLMTRFSGQK